MELVVYGVWAIATLVVWGLVVRYDWRAYNDEKTDRRKDGATLWSDVALLASAVAGVLTVVLVVIAREYPTLRGLSTAVFFGGFLGAFLAAGIVKLTLRRRVKL